MSKCPKKCQCWCRYVRDGYNLVVEVPILNSYLTHLLLMSFHAWCWRTLCPMTKGHKMVEFGSHLNSRCKPDNCIQYSNPNSNLKRIIGSATVPNVIREVRFVFGFISGVLFLKQRKKKEMISLAELKRSNGYNIYTTRRKWEQRKKAWKYSNDSVPMETILASLLNVVRDIHPPKWDRRSNLHLEVRNKEKAKTRCCILHFLG